MKLKSWFNLLLLAIFLLLQAYILFLKPFSILDFPRYINEEPLPLFGDTQYVCQEFHSSGPLERIDIMLANYKIKPEGGTLRLSIFKNNRCLYVKNRSAAVEDNRFYSFNLTQARIPAGDYRLRLDYLRQNEHQRLAVWISRQDHYPLGQLFLNGKPIQGDMTFRVFYTSSLWKERERWLNFFPPFPLRRFILIAGFLLLLFVVNFSFYFLVSQLIHPIPEFGVQENKRAHAHEDDTT